MCFAIFIVKSYGYIASLFSMIRYILTCSWQKSTVYYDVLHQKVLITRLCYPVKIWTDLSCSKTWHNLYRMITPHLQVGYALCRYILHYGEGEGYSISLFFVRFLFSIFGVWIWITGDVGSGVDDVQGHPRADLQMFRQSPFQIVSLLT